MKEFDLVGVTAAMKVGKLVDAKENYLVAEMDFETVAWMVAAAAAWMDDVWVLE